MPVSVFFVIRLSRDGPGRYVIIAGIIDIARSVAMDGSEDRDTRLPKACHVGELADVQALKRRYHLSRIGTII